MTLEHNHAVGPPRLKRENNKLLPALGALSLAAGCQTATQFFAHAFDYQAALGAHTAHL